MTREVTEEVNEVDALMLRLFAASDADNAVALARAARQFQLQANSATDPALRIILFDVARRLMDLGKPQDALRIATRLIATRLRANTRWPHRSELNQLRAEALEALGRWDEAAKARERALDAVKADGAANTETLAAYMDRLVRTLGHVEPSDAVRDRQLLLAQEAERMRLKAAADWRAVEPLSATRLQQPIPSVAEIFKESYDETSGITQRVVFFATNRVPTADKDPYRSFSNDRATSLSYGRAVVTLPPGRYPGAYPHSRKHFQRNKMVHIVLANLALERHDALIAHGRDMLDQAKARTGRREALVYVHGFKTQFGEALERAAQLSEDLNIDGVTAAFVWPSRGHIFGYWADREEATDKAIEMLASFLLDVKTAMGTDTVHLVAHSMGCRFLTKALDKLAARHAAAGHSGKLFDQVVYAAPDLDSDDFEGPVQRGAMVARRATLYQSKWDFAIKASWLFNGRRPRAGDASLPIASSVFDAVDASSAPSTTFGHDYITIGVVEDLRAMLWASLHASQRTAHLREQRLGDNIYYIYDEAKDPVAGPAIRHASFLYRVYGARAKERLAEAMSTLNEIADARLRLSYEATMNFLDTFLTASAEVIDSQTA